MQRRRIISVLVVAVSFAIVLPGIPTAAADEPHPEYLPSFAESPGCGALDGVRGPLASKSGVLSMSEPVYGPWADFFGRSIQAIYDQLVPVYLPTHGHVEYVHERVYPAIELVLENLAAEAALGNVYDIRNDTYSWWRTTVPPGRHLSFHASGSALDINATTNPYSAENVLITNMPAFFVDAWRDAGWCWGGDWQSIKDPMHFSWMGPLHTPGYVMPAPQAPLVNYSAFEPGYSFDVVFDSGPGGSNPHFAVDIDRDGAVDVIRVRYDGSGHAILEAARARNGYHWSQEWAETVTAPSNPSAAMTLADVTRDGRPDLIYLADDGGMVGLEVFPLVQSGELSAATMETMIPFVPGDEYLFGDFNRDGHTDLYLVRPGGPGLLQVWLGPGFDSVAVNLQTGFAEDARLAVDDRDLDGIDDLFIMSPGGLLEIRTGASGFTAVGTVQTNVGGTSERLFVEDLDGDGHADLLMVDSDGDLRMRRGGVSSHYPGIWFQLASHRVERYGGKSRYETAAVVARGEFPSPNQVSTVFVATGTGFADALAGATAAGRVGAPLLLVDLDSIPVPTLDELERLDPDSIVVLGGAAAISDAVVNQLGAYGTTIRLAGGSRYETAVAVSQFSFPEAGSAAQVLIATGTHYADAVAGAAAAGQFNAPVLLTAPDHLPATVRAEIQRLDPGRIVILGGTSAVSGGVAAELAGLAPTIRISGSNRYETAVALSREAFPNGSERIFLATGLNFPDALTGAAAAAASGDPVLLIPGTYVPSSVRAEINRLGTYSVILLGGSAVISSGVASTIGKLGL